MISLEVDRAAFAAQRRKALTDNDRMLLPAVRRALRRYGQGQWWEPALDAAERAFRRIVREETGTTRQPDLQPAIDAFTSEIGRNLRRTTEPTNPAVTANTITRWLSTAVVNAATLYATGQDEEDLGKEWVSMHDDRVRHSHQLADGQVVPLIEKFQVDGVRVDYPGQPVGEPALWINCRCVARPVKLGTAQGEVMTDLINADTTYAVTMAGPQVVDQPVDEQPDDEVYDFQPVPWHGVLAPEGVTSGDKRRFSADALSWRDLPLPLSWQRVADEKHKGAIVVGQITDIWRDGNLVRGKGYWDQSGDADEAFRQVVDGMLRGVSVDVDDVTMEFQAEDGRPTEDGGIATFTQGRICGATLVAIPAFQEAFIQVGEPVTAAGVSEKPWDGSASRYTDEQYRRACVLDRGPGAGSVKERYGLPIREPGGQLSRAGVHAAAQRIGSVKGASPSQIAAAKSKLRAAYRQLGEDPPDSLNIENPEVFGRGPGWVTNPVATKRIHDYWVHGPGAAKIQWGVPGDFNRCRVEVGEEIGESSPAKLRFINQICAQWHHDAIGVWPGREAGGHHGAHLHSAQECDSDACQGPAALVASAAATATRRAEFFADPSLLGPSPLVVTQDGHVFGHLATWGICHIGIGEACITAPHSATDYAYFHTGAVDLDDGSTISVGHITLGGGHADRFVGYRAAVEHYDDTASCVADVIAGEDEYGIWLSGQVRPEVTDEQVAALRAAALSGDWRPIGSGLELVAALCVNVPGFPIPRAELALSGGVQVSLVAAGALPPQPENPQAIRVKLASAVVDEIERRDRQRRMAALRGQANHRKIESLRSL